MPTDPKVGDFLQTQVPLLVRDFAPEQLILFGSCLRGDHRDDSDLDLIIVSGKFHGVPVPLRIGQVLRHIDFALHVDCICYTPEEFTQAIQRSYIVREAMDYGLSAA